MDSFGPPRRPCFIEEDDGLASLAGKEAGYLGSRYQNHSQNGFFSTPFCYSRRSSSLRNLSSSSLVSSPRSARFYDGRFEDPQSHFLDACFLCKKSLANRDIFMYRGDTPFCSEECRQEQIDMDDAKEKKNLSSSMKALREKEQRKSSSPTKDEDYPLRTSTVAAA